MRSPILLLLAATLVVNCASAQTALKFGSNLSHVASDGNSTTTVGVDLPSVFFFRPNNKYIDTGFEELKFFHDKPSYPNAQRTTEFAVSPFVEYGFLIGSSESPLKFKAGGRAIFDNFLGRYQTSESATLSSGYGRSTAALALTPGFLYAFSERLFLDGGISMGLLTFGRYSYRVDNPAIPIRQQKGSEWRHHFVPGVYNFKIGVVYRLSNPS